MNLVFNPLYNKNVKREPRKKHTEVSTNNVHVSVVSFSGDGIRRTVAISEHRRSEISDKRKNDQNQKPCDPTKLSYRPRQWQNSGAYHRRDNMRTRRKPRPRPLLSAIVINVLCWIGHGVDVAGFRRGVTVLIGVETLHSERREQRRLTERRR